MTFLMSTLLVAGLLTMMSAIDNRSIRDEWNALITGQTVGAGGMAGGGGSTAGGAGGMAGGGGNPGTRPQGS